MLTKDKKYNITLQVNYIRYATDIIGICPIENTNWSGIIELTYVPSDSLLNAAEFEKYIKHSRFKATIEQAAELIFKRLHDEIKPLVLSVTLKAHSYNHKDLEINFAMENKEAAGNSPDAHE